MICSFIALVRWLVRTKWTWRHRWKWKCHHCQVWFSQRHFVEKQLLLDGQFCKPYPVAHVKFRRVQVPAMSFQFFLTRCMSSSYYFPIVLYFTSAPWWRGQTAPVLSANANDMVMLSCLFAVDILLCHALKRNWASLAKNWSPKIKHHSVISKSLENQISNLQLHLPHLHLPLLLAHFIPHSASL